MKTDTHIDAPSDLDLLARMLLIRAYEEHLAELAARGPAPMVCSSQGQEASAVGLMAALLPEDEILTAHRSAGHLLARGADPARLLGELYGKASGYCGGKSGSLHISAKELGVVLTSTIVGGQLSMATGVALARKMARRPGIVACVFGDGAATEGIFHESLNLAAVWQLPLLYVCENNQWQAFVPRRETMVGEHIAPWAERYGMAHQTVDGNDVRAVRAATEAARAYIEATGQPYLLETWTYRQRGHYSGDNGAHIDPAERAHWQALDPIDQLAAALRLRGDLDDQGLQTLRQLASEQIRLAHEAASAAPAPAAGALLTDVYA